MAGSSEESGEPQVSRSAYVVQSIPVLMMVTPFCH